MPDDLTFYTVAPHWTDKWCTGATYRGDRLVMPHWACTALCGDARVWNWRQCPDCHCARMNAHNAVHIDLVRHRSKERYSARRDEILHRMRERHIADPDRRRRRDRERYAANPEPHRRRDRERRASNPELERQRVRAYQQTPAGKAAIHRARMRRRDLLGKAVCEHGTGCAAAAVAELPSKCAVPGCRHTEIATDHIVPIARGGKDCRWNIQRLCAHHNQSKNASDPVDWQRRNGLAPAVQLGL